MDTDTAEPLETPQAAIFLSAHANGAHFGATEQRQGLREKTSSFAYPPFHLWVEALRACPSSLPREKIGSGQPKDEKNQKRQLHWQIAFGTRGRRCPPGNGMPYMMLLDWRRCRSATRRAEEHLQELRGAQCSRNAHLRNEQEGLERGLAEAKGVAGVLGTCGRVRWARRNAVFLCPPLLRKGDATGMRRAKDVREAAAACVQSLSA